MMKKILFISMFSIFLAVSCSKKSDIITKAEENMTDDQKVASSLNRIKDVSNATNDMFDEIESKAKAGK